MNCYSHPDVEAVAFCRICGRPLCAACQRSFSGTVFCAEHVPERPPVTAPAAPPAQPTGSSPGLAFVLGLIPGVGAIYNSQYTKGFLHVVVFGTLVSILASDLGHPFEPLFGILLSAWIFYMAFEAYHTAARRQRGLPVDEFSSFFPTSSSRTSSLAGPVALIVIGAVFLAMTVWPEWIREIFRFWPVLLIAAGVYLLVARIKERSNQREDASRGGSQ